MLNRGRPLLVPGACLVLLAAVLAAQWLEGHSSALANATNVAALGALLVLGLALLAARRLRPASPPGPRVLRGFAFVLLGALAGVGVVAALPGVARRTGAGAAGPGTGRVLVLGGDDDVRPRREDGARFDEIEMLALDSPRALGTTALRAARFNLTIEALETLRHSLDKDGTLVLEVRSEQPRFVDRVMVALGEAFAEHPALYRDTRTGGSVLVDGRANRPLHAWLKPLSIPSVSYSPLPALLTDDRTEEPEELGSPGVQAAALVAIALVVALGALRVSPRSERRATVHYVLLGSASWLLLAWSQLALVPFLGTSGTVSALGAGAFLLLTLLATALVALDRAPGERVGAALLAVTLLGSVAVPLAVGAAVFFAGIVLARSLERAPRLDGPLGAWLLGCALGGVLERAHLLAGLRALPGVALVAFVLALWAHRVTR